MGDLRRVCAMGRVPDDVAAQVGDSHDSWTCAQLSQLVLSVRTATRKRGGRPLRRVYNADVRERQAVLADVPQLREVQGPRCRHGQAVARAILQLARDLAIADSQFKAAAQNGERVFIGCSCTEARVRKWNTESVERLSLSEKATRRNAR